MSSVEIFNQIKNSFKQISLNLNYCYRSTSPTRHQLISGIGIPLQLQNEAITLGLTMKAQYLLPDTNATSFKPVYYPNVFNTSGLNMQIYDAQNNQNSPFPSYFGRRRREIKADPNTGEKFEVYEGEIKEAGNEELKNEIPQNDEAFEDEYEGDYEYEYERFPIVSDFPRPNEQALKDTSGTRWLMYDGFADLLHKQGLNGRECVLKSICEVAEVNFTHHSGIFGEIFHVLFT